MVVAALNANNVRMPARECGVRPMKNASEKIIEAGIIGIRKHVLHMLDNGEKSILKKLGGGGKNTIKRTEKRSLSSIGNIVLRMLSG